MAMATLRNQDMLDYFCPNREYADGTSHPRANKGEGLIHGEFFFGAAHQRARLPHDPSVQDGWVDLP